MRRLLAAVAILAGSFPAGAAAELSEPALRNAYTYAVRCFAVTPFAKRRGMSSDDGNRAFGAAYDTGVRLGHTPQSVGQDVQARTKGELKKMHDDPAYLNQALSDCKKLGLL